MGNKKVPIIFIFSLIILIGVFGVVSAVVSDITVISPNGGEFWSGTQQITWEAVGCDPSSDFLNIQRSTGSAFTTIATVSCSPTIFNWDTTTVSDNTNYQIRIFLDGDPGTNDISDAVFTIDNTPPTVNAGDDKTANAEFTQNGVVSDNFNIASIEWTKVSGTGIITFGSQNSAVTTISADTDGEYVLRLTTTDEAGNSAFDEMILSWDNTPPTVAFYTLNGEEANAFFNPGIVNIAITATEPVEWVSAKIVKVDDVNVFKTKFPSNDGFATTSFTWDGSLSGGPNPVDGEYKILVHITDLAGNDIVDLELTPFHIFVDTQNPTISALSNPVADTVYKTGVPIPITFTPTDPAPGTPLTCGYKVGTGGTFVSLGSCTSVVEFTDFIIESDLTDGRNDIFGIVMDSVGNTAETSPVSIVFDNDNTLSVPSDFSTIQSAIDAASPGDTIQVAAGTYNEQITIDKSLTLSGDVGDASAGPGPSAPILDGGASVGSAITLAVGVSNIIIEGFEIHNYRNRILGTKFSTGGIGSAILAWNSGTSNVIVRDNYMHDLGWNAVLVGNEGQALHDNWLVSSNKIINVAFTGIELTNTQNSQVIGNEITGGEDILGEVDDDSQDGILIQTQIHTGSGLTVVSNTVDNNIVNGTHARAGIELLSWVSTNSLTAELNDVKVRNNNVNGAKRGIYIFSIIFSFTEPQPTGTSALIDNVNITGNILDTNDDGIQIKDFGGGTHGTISIINNDIINSGPSSGIHLLSGTSATGISVNENVITNNALFGINHESTDTLNAKDNWWGSNQKSTIKSGISGLVDFTPWAYNSNVDTDHEEPTTTIDSPLTSSWQKEDFTVSLTDTDTGGAGLSECEYRVKSNNVITKDWSVRTCSNPITLTVGSDADCRDEGTDICKVFAKASDASGNEGTEVSRTFNIDFTNPTIDLITAPTLTSDTTITVTGTFTELNINTITVNGVTATLGTGTYSADIPLTEGPNTITVVATDLAGNSVTDPSNSVILDTTGPSITDVTEIIGRVVGESSEVSATVTDPNGVASVTLHYTVDGVSGSTPMTNVGDVYSATIPASTENGIVEYEVEATDSVGNSETSGIFTILVNDLIWDLNSQWNLVSVPKTLAIKDRTLLLGNTVHEYNAEDGIFVTNPSTINPGVGYWVDNIGETSLGLDYATLTSNQTLPSETIILEQGWNLIGHMCTSDQPVETAFPSDIYNNLFVLRYEETTDSFEIYATQGGIPATFGMVPGEGYWVFVPEGDLAYTNTC